MVWFLRDEAGQGLVEYGLILVLMSVVALAALTQAGTSVNSLLNAVSNTMSSVTTGS